LRDVTATLGEALSGDARGAYRLRADRRDRILAEARGDVVAFPGAQSEMIASMPRKRGGYYRRHAGLVAAAFALVVGGILGHETGRERYDAQVSRTASTLEVPVAQLASDTPETVHPYPPAYGLDQPGAWRVRSVSPSWRGTTGFSPSHSRPPAYYGLPGPRSEYLDARHDNRPS